MVPAYNDTYNKMYNALPSRDGSAIDMLGQWPVVLDEILPLYSTCREQIRLLVENLYDGITAKTDGPIIGKFQFCQLCVRL